MFKFGPLLAYAVAMNFSARYLFGNYEELKKELAQSKFDRLDIMHHLSAGFKATFSRIAYDGIDACR